MKRMFALLFLLSFASGCMMLEDMMYVDQPAQYAHSYTSTEPPRGSCGAAQPFVSMPQSVEPELLPTRR